MISTGFCASVTEGGHCNLSSALLKKNSMLVAFQLAIYCNTSFTPYRNFTIGGDCSINFNEFLQLNGASQSIKSLQATLSQTTK